MKYLYKGMGLPGWGDVSGSVLLGWHEKVRQIPHLSISTFPNPTSVDGSRRNRLYR
jgi:ARP2/3 complex 16 kDa subunit (p16-Arc)